jgi:hypothetical protein
VSTELGNNLFSMKVSQEQKILDVWKETTFFQMKRAGDEEQNKVLKAVN